MIKQGSLYENMIDNTEPSTSSGKILLNNSEKYQSEITFANSIDREDETRDLNFVIFLYFALFDPYELDLQILNKPFK